RHGVTRLALHLGDGKAMEFAHCRCSPATRSPLVRLEIVERLEAREAAVVRLARRRSELGQELRLSRSAAWAGHRRAAAQRTDACDIDPGGRGQPAHWRSVGAA